MSFKEHFAQLKSIMNYESDDDLHQLHEICMSNISMCVL